MTGWRPRLELHSTRPMTITLRGYCVLLGLMVDSAGLVRGRQLTHVQVKPQGRTQWHFALAWLPSHQPRTSSKPTATGRGLCACQCKPFPGSDRGVAGSVGDALAKCCGRF
ncbi:hypothetical protein BD309DRAFT_966704 [Dichomitus squalens]|uniref:Uncharacterized protein n=1 Tax=Dichomitus squalens TaxID=114155 RepID=A0A4Q9Q619_9APHY|nr:hypothetical protein BD309DRAFT_966704 [Dichomitus squalens]TBU62570.1 hypothetical protein BD310DRAFT_918696 [Dichomitus squalens]